MKLCLTFWTLVKEVRESEKKRERKRERERKSDKEEKLHVIY